MNVNFLKEEIRSLYQKGDFQKALELSEYHLTVSPSDVWFHSLIGELLNKVLLSNNARYALSYVINKNESAYYSKLMLGRLLERENEYEDAYKCYSSALKHANSLGFWHSDSSTPEWSRSFVRNALNYVELYRKDVVGVYLESLRDKYGINDIYRVTQGIRMFSGDLPFHYEDSRQRPSFLYIPGLPIRPVFESKEIELIDYYESNYSVILNELELLLDKQHCIPSYTDNSDGLTQGGDWDALFFFRHGEYYKENAENCPKTTNVLNKLPLVHISKHSPEVCFSVLRPGAHILPHRGVTNSRSVLHLGLKIPKGCRLNLCEIAEVEWSPGRAFLFDDTYLHEAWNKSDQSRYVLLADVWNPYLSEVERLAIKDFVEWVSILS